MTKAKKITISILSLFLSAIFIFAIIFCILCFPIADTIDDEFISQDVSLSEIKANYQEVFVDDFNNGTLDVNSWNFEGSGVNRNNELQSYADNMEDGNIFFEDDCLNIVAKEESRNGKNYTSASITTQGKVAYRYGIFEMRAKLPFGNGLWPAFWLMGQTNFFNAQLWPVKPVRLTSWNLFVVVKMTTLFTAQFIMGEQSSLVRFIEMVVHMF